MRIDKVKPSLREERCLWRRGFRFVCGIDEVGRGPLAGPVVAAAVLINPNFKIRNSKQCKKLKKLKNQKSKTPITDFSNIKNFLLPLGVNDSKKLTERQREAIYEKLIKSKLIDFGIGIIPEKIIDRINIKNASEYAMLMAVKKLKHKPDFLLIDGNDLKNKELLRLNHHLIVRGDQKVFSIAAASIIAKVARDRLMKKYDRKFPNYGFKIHKGYPTPLHLKMLKKYGPCKIHRQSFAPVEAITNNCLA